MDIESPKVGKGRSGSVPLLRLQVLSKVIRELEVVQKEIKKRENQDYLEETNIGKLSQLSDTAGLVCNNLLQSAEKSIKKTQLFIILDS